MYAECIEGNCDVDWEFTDCVSENGYECSEDASEDAEEHSVGCHVPNASACSSGVRKWVGMVMGNAVKKFSGKRDGDTERLGDSRATAGAAAINSAARVSQVRRLEVHCSAKGSISMKVVKKCVKRGVPTLLTRNCFRRQVKKRFRKSIDEEDLRIGFA